MEPEKSEPEVFVLHNTSRSIHNRNQRAAEPATGRRRQVLTGEARVMKGRPLVVTKDWLEKNSAQVKAQIAAGLVQVRTRDGLLIDLNTGTVEAVPVPAPAPNPPLDSVKNDRKVGENIPQMAGGLSLADLTATGGGSLEGIPGPKTAQDKADEQAAFEAADLGGDPAADDVVFESTKPSGKGKGGKR